MPSVPNQILLLSDNGRTVACLERALARQGGIGGEMGFCLHTLDSPERLEHQLTNVTPAVDAAIVDGTGSAFANCHLDGVLHMLDRHQLGAVLLTDGETAASGPVPGGLVWPVAIQRLDTLAAVLAVIAGYQGVTRQLNRELSLFQRLKGRISGRFSELDEEMRLASRMQNDFLPKRLPAVGPAAFATLYRPATWVSGDIYDVFRLDETHIGFYIADAVGHGMPAALLTMFIKRSMETKQIGRDGYRLFGADETLGSLNRALVEAALSPSQFTTAIYAILNVETLELEFARGGHPHPVWLHADGTVSEPQTEGALLGVFADARFERHTIRLVPGDKFVIYSDGLEPALTEDDEAINGDCRDALKALRHLPAQAMLESLVERMDKLAGSLHPRDDTTLVVLEIQRAGN